MSVPTYTGVAATLEGALQTAHSKIRPIQGKDFTSSKIIAWGMQFGGFAQQARFWVEIVGDESAPFRSDG